MSSLLEAENLRPIALLKPSAIARHALHSISRGRAQSIQKPPDVAGARSEFRPGAGAGAQRRTFRAGIDDILTVAHGEGRSKPRRPQATYRRPTGESRRDLSMERPTRVIGARSKREASPCYERDWRRWLTATGLASKRPLAIGGRQARDLAAAPILFRALRRLVLQHPRGDQIERSHGANSHPIKPLRGRKRPQYARTALAEMTQRQKQKFEFGRIPVRRGSASGRARQAAFRCR